MKKISRLMKALAVAAVITGCGGAAVQTNPIEAGQPPEGMGMDGVWFSNWGRMEFTQNGNGVEGLYEGERKRGAIKGQIDGDLVKFEWTEWEFSVQGKPRETKGHGVFKYTVQQEGPYMKHHIDGTWGYDESDMGGGKWSAVKSAKGQKKLKPFDPNAEMTEAERAKAAAGFVDEGEGSSTEETTPGESEDSKDKEEKDSNDSGDIDL